MHRGGLFNLERLKYKQRCAEAVASNNLRFPSVMSLIIDGMDQNHCRVPYLGGQSRFSSPINQHITGKNHALQFISFAIFKITELILNLNNFRTQV